MYTRHRFQVPAVARSARSSLTTACDEVQLRFAPPAAWRIVVALACAMWLGSADRGNVACGEDTPSETPPEVKPIGFRSDIAPILLDHCLACHGAKLAEGGYRVDSYQELLKAGDSGETPVVTAASEDPAQVSELLRRLECDESERMPAESDPLSAEQIVVGLEAAVGAADFCGLLRAIDAAEPDPDDRDGATDVYRALAAATRSARPFVPKELRTPWEDIVVGTDEAATAIEEHDGDVSDPELDAALTSTAMVEALESVERYQITSCPPPVAGG